MKKLIAMATMTGIALTACESTPPAANTTPMTPANTTMREAPASDENACIVAVGNETGNTAVVVSSITSEANNTVVIGVGPQLARWQCLVKDGKVSGVMSLTNEGAA
jgi:hypothetical protein